MSTDDHGAERWKELEAEARATAESMTDPEARRIMLFIAEGYRLLAKGAVARKTHKR